MCFCCGETGVHEETQPARPGDHNLPRMPRPGLKPGHRQKDEPSATGQQVTSFCHQIVPTLDVSK